MVQNADGTVKQGSLARIEPDAVVVRMWEAIETYIDRNQPLIIIAGADYGQGSSRDWAAKGVRLAGVEVIVAEGFERKNGEIETVPVLCRLDSDSDVRTYKVGGVLREFASKFSND